jgi:drug/metabolite transporter (DMT)-like permease
MDKAQSGAHAPRWAWPVLLAGVLAVSTGALFVRLADPAPALAKAAWRCGIAALALFLIGRRSALRHLANLPSREKRLMLAAGALLAVHFGTWIQSLAYTSVTSSLVLVTTTPIWTALLAPWLLREATSKRQWQGIFACLIGILVLAQGELQVEGLAWLGDLLALAGALSFALFLIVGRRLQRSLAPLPYLLGAYGIAAVLLAATCLISGQALLSFPAETYRWLILLALVPQLIGHSAYNLSLRHFSAATVSITLVGEPIFGSLLAWGILREIPSPSTLLGGGILLLGIVWASLSQKAACAKVPD